MDKLKDEKFAEFHKKFLGVIAPKYDAIEFKRFMEADKFKKNVCRDIIFLLPILLIYSISYFFKETVTTAFINLLISVFFCFALVFLFELHTNNKTFKYSLKELLLPLLLDNLTNNGNIHAENQRNISNEELKESDLFADFNNIMGDDNFAGNYKGVDFKISELELNKESDDIHLKVFKGAVLKLKFNKTAKAKTVLSSKNLLTAKAKTLKNAFCVNAYYIFAIAGFIFALGCLIYMVLMGLFQDDALYYCILFIFVLIFFALIAKFVIFDYSKNITKSLIHLFKMDNKLQPVILEDSKFNRKFNVFSSDQVEARYLVTPAFMERFYNLKTVFGAKNIRCSFFGDNLMIAIETKRDLFELGNLFKPIRDAKTIERFYDEINAIFELIDYFKLNENIHLK